MLHAPLNAAAKSCSSRQNGHREFGRFDHDRGHSMLDTRSITPKGLAQRPAKLRATSPRQRSHEVGLPSMPA